MIEVKDIFNKEYAYAQANGYMGTHDDYARKQYSVYGVLCVRNGVNPMSWYNWLQNQKKN